MFTCHSRNFRAIGRNTSISEKVYVIVQFCTICQRPDRKEAVSFFRTRNLVTVANGPLVNRCVAQQQKIQDPNE